jgi:lysophospholipase L1-like esterase
MQTPPRLCELVRFCHPEKILGATRLPGTLSDDAIAALYGTDEATYRAHALALAEEARRAAGGLRDRVAALPFAPDSQILAVGDSITDDAGSWAEILAHALGARAAVHNGGLSGDTTTGAITRVTRLTAGRPAWAIVVLGTNDARRHGRDGEPMLVSHAETRRNLRALDAALRRRCRHVVWITPPPVADPALAEPDLIWHRDDVAAKADLVRALDPGAVDLWPGFSADHLSPDGLHPSPAGQMFIAERLIETLQSVAGASRPRSA